MSHYEHLYMSKETLESSSQGGILKVIFKVATYSSFLRLIHETLIKDLNENCRFQLLMEVLRKNNSLNGLGTYLNTKVVEELRNTSKQTIENVVKALDEKYLRTKPERFQELVKEILDFKILGGEKAEDVWDKINKVRSMIDEEKMNANMDLFVLMMMMVKAKESRIFSDGEEIVLKQTIK